MAVFGTTWLVFLIYECSYNNTLALAVAHDQHFGGTLAGLFKALQANDLTSVAQECVVERNNRRRMRVLVYALGLRAKMETS